MKKSLKLHAEEFESSTRKTEQYKVFHRTFKREFSLALYDIDCKDVQIGKSNHFDISGFFMAHDNQWWYFRIEDLRWWKDRMLIRTADHPQDYTGGSNTFIPVDDDLISNIDKLINQ